MGNKIGGRRPVVDEKYARPQGLYQHRDVDPRKLWKLILDSNLEEESSLDLEECPICFLYCTRLNRSWCCKKVIYTDEVTSFYLPDKVSLLRNLKLHCGISSCEVKDGKGLGTSCKFAMEKHWVFEAQIKMQQQELQDEAERIQKRKDASSSSRIVTAGGVEYHDSLASLLSVSSLRYPAQSGLIPSQGSFTVPANR